MAKTTTAPRKTAAAKTAKPAAAKKAAPEPTNCRCGCGEATNPGRMFRQGHDQRLVSRIAEDLVEGTGRGMRILTAEDAKEDIEWRINQVRDYVSEKVSAALGAKVYNASMRRWQFLEAKTKRQAERAARQKGTNGEAKPRRTRKSAAAKQAVTVPVGEVPADPFQGIPEEGTEHPRKADNVVPIRVPADVPETDTAPPARKSRRRVGPVKTAALGLGAPIKIKVRSRVIEAEVAAMNQAGKVTVASYVDGRGNDKRVENPKMVSHPDAQVGTA